MPFPYGEHSWGNDGWVEPPHWLELSWDTPITTQHLEAYSTDHYSLFGFSVQYYVNGDRASVQESSGSTTGAHTSMPFRSRRPSCA